MIVVVGEALVDLVVQPDGAVVAALGGAPFNTARTCGRLGADVAFLGAIGTDRFGERLLERLAEDGVAVGDVQRVDAPTTLAAAELDERGVATYRFYLAGTSAPALTGLAWPVGTTAVFTGGLALVLEPMADTVVDAIEATDPDVVVVVDVNLRPAVIDDAERYRARLDRVLRRADVVKVSDEDLAHLRPGASAVDAARELLAAGPRVVLLTRGADGVTVLAGEERRDVPVAPVEVVDTIGAGDAFGGGFLAWWTLTGRAATDLGDLDAVVDAVTAASAVAGVVCRRRGADPPWRAELPAGWAP